MLANLLTLSGGSQQGVNSRAKMSSAKKWYWDVRGEGRGRWSVSRPYYRFIFSVGMDGDSVLCSAQQVSNQSTFLLFVTVKSDKNPSQLVTVLICSCDFFLRLIDLKTWVRRTSLCKVRRCCDWRQSIRFCNDIKSTGNILSRTELTNYTCRPTGGRMLSHGTV